ncbi:Not1 N-terminal domain, CCR4-Not complex component protein [Cardiosporidium cionae]|uniref:Not1 N-terminal domain, CCR4-Not complex component protein n=1 Tax=Cardiosporidium cionae TaxID=476202 RepID=A0ABQ7J7T3_9APIC|nr:Not1 N-terminal domain, CCR4-Not complex component protein [Cardiosporidium cionae]|eukprot:KAF8820056.1 Not1 N-terminal domain, CCR4-Not complex component protein [Cardiosporidium cionae]
MQKKAWKVVASMALDCSPLFQIRILFFFNMSEKRRLQQDIEKTLKRVDDGIIEFEDICSKFHSCVSQAQKEKYEGELKREIKKLQRYRDTIKGWQASSDVKDKNPLEEARKRIEKEMEHFKLCERETKIKAFSKEGLAAKTKMDPHEEGRSRHRDWLNESISKLTSAMDTYEAEQETLTKKGKSKNPGRSTLLLKWIASHQFHLQKLQQVLRRLENDSLIVRRRSMPQLDELNDNITNYMDLVEQCDTVFGEEIYADLYLDDGIEETYGPFESYTNEEKSESAAESVKDKIEEISRTDEMKAASSTIVISSLSRNKGSSAASGRAADGSPSHEPLQSMPWMVETGASYASITSVGGRPEPYVKERYTASLLSPSSTSGISKGMAEEAMKAKGLLSTLMTASPRHKGEGQADDASESLPLLATFDLEESPTDGSDGEESASEEANDAWHDGEGHPEGESIPLNEKWMDATVREGDGLPRGLLSVPLYSPQGGAEMQPSSRRGEFSGISEEPHDEDVLSTIPEGTTSLLSTEGDIGTYLKEGMGEKRPCTSPIPKKESEGYEIEKPPTQQTDTSPPLHPLPLPDGTRRAADTMAHGSHGEVFIGRNSLPPGTLTNPPNGLLPSTGISSSQGLTTGPNVGQRSLEGMVAEEDSASSHLAWLQEQLKISYANSPMQADCDRRRHHIPRVPWMHPHPSFPLNPSINFDSSKFFERLNVDTLFLVFYYQQGTYQQFLAARELKKKSWRFHKQLLAWFQRHEEPRVATETSERGNWCSRVEADFLFEYIWLENESLD